MHVMRLAEETKTLLALEELKEKIGFKGPIIGVHVRHGDACHTTLRKGMCKGIGVYLPHLRMLSEKYGTKRGTVQTASTHTPRNLHALSYEKAASTQSVFLKRLSPTTTA